MVLADKFKVLTGKFKVLARIIKRKVVVSAIFKLIQQEVIRPIMVWSSNSTLLPKIKAIILQVRHQKDPRFMLQVQQDQQQQLVGLFLVSLKEAIS